MEGIVCIAGTNRPNNYTARALGIVVDALRQSHVDPLVFDARALSLAFPGQPDPGDGERLRTAIAAAPGVILATPEYHGSFCAMTKLIIENLGFPSVLAGKPVALVGVAAGRIGAIKALEHLKSVCAHIGAIVAYSTDSCHPIHGKVATQSPGSLPPSPRETCHSVPGKVATHSRRSLPPSERSDAGWHIMSLHGLFLSTGPAVCA